MLKKSASFVLASKASSTETPPHHSAARTDVVLLIRRTVRPRGYASGAFIACGLAERSFRASCGNIFLLCARCRPSKFSCATIVSPRLARGSRLVGWLETSRG